jgi:adenylate kinase
MIDRRHAILLLGPTGSGKSPLGHLLEQSGRWGRRCVHFDFGAELRKAGKGTRGQGLTPSEQAVVRLSLRNGTLLENEHFPIARQLLTTFLRRARVGAGDLVVLNGLPRHAGQAAGVAEILEVVLVVSLCCMPQVVLDRIRHDPAGDRRGRVDDDLDAVTGKLRLFGEQTLPLIGWYRDRNVPVVELEVGSASLPDELNRQLPTRLPADAGA